MNNDQSRKRALTRSSLLDALIFMGFAILLASCSMNAQVQSDLDKQTSAGNQGQLNSTVKKDASALTKASLKEFEDLLIEMKQAGIAASTYEQKLSTMQEQASRMKQGAAYYQLNVKIAKEKIEMHMAISKNNARTLLNRMTQHAEAWGNANTYQNPHDGKAYVYNKGYWPSVGMPHYYESTIESEGEHSSGVLTDVKNAFFNHYMLELNFEDKTPFSEPHAVDKALMEYYGFTSGQVVLVSLTEQTMRIYQDGKLTRAHHITAGRENKPSMIGGFSLFDRHQDLPYNPDPNLSPSDPDWYEPRVVDYTVEYYIDGYYFHSSPWRKDYGPGTQFPHTDSSGNSESWVGSHGCINLSPEKMKWFYENTTDQTIAIIF